MSWALKYLHSATKLSGQLHLLVTGAIYSDNISN